MPDLVLGFGGLALSLNLGLALALRPYRCSASPPAGVSSV